MNLLFTKLDEFSKKKKRKNEQNSCCTVSLEHILKKMCLCSLFDYSVIAFLRYCVGNQRATENKKKKMNEACREIIVL